MKTKDIRSMTSDEIGSKLVESQDKLFKQKFQKVLGQAENPYKIKNTRKDIARMLTILAEKRLEHGSEKKD
ncbi:MAG: 50S ribosomal protein L29 [Candidatus Aminicenantes bacterium]|nr:50S ribosomal protein L29 [Candidatus Aminicenantes bacterium]